MKRWKKAGNEVWEDLRAGSCRTLEALLGTLACEVQWEAFAGFKWKMTHCLWQPSYETVLKFRSRDWSVLNQYEFGGSNKQLVSWRILQIWLRGLLTDGVQYKSIRVKGNSWVLSCSNCKDGAVIYWSGEENSSSWVMDLSSLTSEEGLVE